MNKTLQATAVALALAYVCIPATTFAIPNINLLQNNVLEPLTVDITSLPAVAPVATTPAVVPPAVVPFPGNLILNPSFENATAGAPTNWHVGEWGTHTSVPTYGAPAWDGVSGATLKITAYTDGDAKWYFDDVAVTAGANYTFTDHYQSTIASTVTVRYTLSNGTFIYTDLDVLPASAAWAAYTKTITPPAGAVSLTVFHLIRAVGTLSVDGYSFVLADTVPPPPAAAPTCTFTLSSASITQGLSSTLSWTTQNATALTIAPTVGPAALSGSIVLSPTTTTTYKGTALGAATTGTCQTTLTVTPAATTSSSNLIKNPSLESDTDANSIPDFWATGSWGTNTTAFQYPVAGVDGARAAKITTTAYTTGDAKWYFNDVPVTGGTTYTVSDRYIATVPTGLTVQYTSTTGTLSYAYLGTFAQSAGWGTASATFTPPAGTATVTVFHTLAAVGSLTVDAFVLAPGVGAPATDAFDRGYVTLTFDDGWLSQYTQALPMLNAFNFKASFYIITNEMLAAVPQAVISNASLETSGVGGVPLGWTKAKTGTNTATYTYPVAGIDGARAATTQITSFVSGSAGWVFAAVTPTDPGDQFEFSDKYIATTPTRIRALFTLDNGTQQSLTVGTVPAAASWQSASFVLTPPNGTATIQIFHELVSNGSLTVDDYHLSDITAYMTTAQVKSIQTAGHEVGAHTKTHPDLTTLTAAQSNTEIAGSRQALLAAGLTPVQTFVYPFGTYNPTIIQQVINAGFIGARTTNGGFNSKSTPLYELKDFEITPTTTFAAFKQAVDTANSTHTWLIVMYHEVDRTGLDYSVSPELLNQMLTYLRDSATSVITMREGLQLPRGAAAVPSVAPATDLTPTGEPTTTPVPTPTVTPGGGGSGTVKVNTVQL